LLLPAPSLFLFRPSALRSIVTPHLLSWNPLKAARIILTPFEQTQPWVLLTAPGLLFVTLIQVIWVTVIVKGVRTVLLPEVANFGPPTPVESPGSSELKSFFIARLVGFFAFQMLSTFLM
jgi:hypothetical protein